MLWCALWTPTDQNGQLLKAELKQHLHFLQTKKVDGVLIAGTTGGFLYLDTPVRKELLKFVSENKGSLKLIFNVSHPSPWTVEEFIHYANNFETGIILLPPIYYPISPSDLIAYFIHMSRRIKRPFYLYNFPERTQVKIGLEVLEQVPCAGIKLSGNDLAHLKAVAAWSRGKDFTIFAGNDILLPESLRLGAHGCMGGLVNIFPEVFGQILKNEGNWEPKLKQLENLVNQLTFPHNIAAFMEARHLPAGAPKMPLSQEGSKKYQKLVEGTKQLLAEWGL